MSCGTTYVPTVIISNKTLSTTWSERAILRESSCSNRRTTRPYRRNGTNNITAVKNNSGVGEKNKTKENLKHPHLTRAQEALKLGLILLRQSNRKELCLDLHLRLHILHIAGNWLLVVLANSGVYHLQLCIFAWKLLISLP